MDLSALLAREGIKADDVDALVKWARQRSSALIARIEPGSPLAAALGASFERVRDSNGTPVPRAPSRSAPRSIARSVSRPYLGAAVEAALSGKQEEVDLAVETAAAEAEAAAEMAERAAAEAQMAASAFEPAVHLDVDLPVLEDSTSSAAEPDAIPDENDPYIGGFNRFAFNFRRREAEVRSRVTQQEDEARRQTLSRGRERGFERGFEDENRPKTGWDHDFNHDFLPDPPGFEADARLRARRSVEPEPSGLLVLGIPDDEGGDVPVRRVRPPSTGTGTGTGISDAPPRAADSGPSESFSAELAALEETSGTFPVAAAESGPFPVPPAASDSGPQAVARAASGPQSGPQAVARPVSGPQYDSGPRAAARPSSGPQAVAHASSGPQAMTRTPSGPQASSGPHTTAGHRGPPPPPPPRSGSAPSPSAKRNPPPPPPSRDGKDRTRTKTTTASPVPPVTPVTKRGKSKPVKKKIVELGQPVARPISAPVAMAAPRQPAPSERSGHRPIPADDEVLTNSPGPKAAPERNASAIPDYLLDDDE